MMPAEREQCILSLTSLITEMKTALAESSDGSVQSKSISEECQWLKIFEHQVTAAGCCSFIVIRNKYILTMCRLFVVVGN